MDFRELIFDVYFLSEKVQYFSNEISGLEFADERSYLEAADVDRLRHFQERLDELTKIAAARLEEIRAAHSEAFERHLDMVTERIGLRQGRLEAQKDERSRFELEQLEDMLIHIRDLRQGRPPRYSVWWVFFFVASVLRRDGEFSFSGKSLPAEYGRISPRCPSCSEENDIGGEIDLFLPPTAIPYEKVTVLDEYSCRACRQRYRVMLSIRFRPQPGFEIVNVDHPPVHLTW